MKTMENAPDVTKGRDSVDRWVGFLRAYFLNFGLPDRDAASVAAERVVSSVREELGQPLEGDLEPLLLGFATRWIESFARESAESSADWFWRAPTLLARFPTTFLETPLPAWSTESQLPALDLLPETSPRTMPQQEIVGPFASIGRTIREAGRVALPSHIDV